MIEAADYKTLELLFGRSGALPPLPTAALKLINLIDFGEASVIDLERTIASDPALSADFLRIAHAGSPTDEGVICTTLRTCILRIGQRAVRAMAVSLLVQGLMRSNSNECLFDTHRFNQHSLFVAFLAKYIYSRRELKVGGAVLTSDEVFAIGVLHDISLAMLAKLAPNVYNRVHLYAQRSVLSLPDAFQRLCGRPIERLGAIACKHWGLPEAFDRALYALEQPWEEPELSDAICAINMADRISERFGWAGSEWEKPRTVLPEVEADAWVPEEELFQAVPRIMALTLQQIPENLKRMEIPQEFFPEQVVA